MGIEKRDLMGDQYEPADLAIQMEVKDAFDPRWLLNPPRCSAARKPALSRKGGRECATAFAPTDEAELAGQIAECSRPAPRAFRAAAPASKLRRTARPSPDDHAPVRCGDL